MLFGCTLRIDEEPDEYLGAWDNEVQVIFNKYLEQKPNGYFMWEFNWEIPGSYSVEDAIYFRSALSEYNIPVIISTYTASDPGTVDLPSNKDFIKTDKEVLMKHLEDIYTVEKAFYCAMNGWRTAFRTLLDISKCPYNEQRCTRPQQPKQKQSFFSKLKGKQNNDVFTFDTPEFDRGKAQIPSYLETIRQFEETLVECMRLLDGLYNMEVVYPKYRDLVAISQICEYFASGRCTELEGPNGAYNLYESELRQNLIISKLDVIITQLDYIQQTQSMLFNAIQQSNRLLENIAQNTAITAFNSKVIADNTEIVKRYTVLGY